MNQYDVIIIGGGIVGCAAAYFLAKSNVKTALIEKDSIAAHASGFAFGMVSQRIRLSNQASPTERLLGISVDIHHSLAESLPQESGIDYNAKNKAALYLALDESDAAQLKPIGVSAFTDTERRPDRNDIRWLGYGELSHIEARVSPNVIGALYLGGQLELSPSLLSKALWKAAEKNGAVLIQDQATQIDLQNGRFQSVQTSDKTLTAETLILAAGPWSSALLKNGSSTSHLNLPVSPLKGQILRYDIGDQPPMPVSIWWNGDYASSKPDGMLYVGTTEENVGFDEEPTPDGRDAIIDSATRVLPFLSQARIARQTACLRPVTPDGLPVIGEMPDAHGIIVATGGGRSGIEMGPGIGKLAADIATYQNRAETSITQPLSPARFS